MAKTSSAYNKLRNNLPRHESGLATLQSPIIDNKYNTRGEAINLQAGKKLNFGVRSKFKYFGTEILSYKVVDVNLGNILFYKGLVRFFTKLKRKSKLFNSDASLNVQLTLKRKTDFFD